MSTLAPRARRGGSGVEQPASAAGVPALGLAAGASAAALVALVLGLVVGGALTPPPAGLPDAGTVVRVGLPVARVLHDASAALTVGLLVLAATVLPLGAVPRAGGRPTARDTGVLQGPALLATRAALWTASLWAAAAAGVAVLTYVELDPAAWGSTGFADGLAFFLQEIDIGRSWVAVVVAACLVAVLAATVTTLGGAAASAVLAVVGLLPLAATGHASGADAHETAVTSLGIHLVGVSVWVGGLATLAVLARSLAPAELATAARRYSPLAAWCFAAVAVSGVVNAWVRIGGLSGLATSYGLLVLGKVALLAALFAFGLSHRRRTLPRIDSTGPLDGRRAFARLAGVEVLVMAAAVGLGVALSRSAPPVPEVPAADVGLLGYPLPPPLDGSAWLTQWRLDLLWALVAVVAAGWYVVAVRRLRRRGDTWPGSRVVLWVAGCALLVYATSGAPGAYGRVLFSAHMVMHMLLSMAVPLLLVMAAPMTLALRTLPARHDGTRGPREWLLVLLHSTYVRVLSHPAVAGVLFAGSLVVFYWSPWFEWSLSNHLGHVVMAVHFLAVGWLFAWVLAGPDPGPRRPPYLLRLVLLFAVVSFHAFFGVAVMGGTSLLAPDWYEGLGRPYATDLLADQQQGGAIAWGFGELPTLVLALLVLLAWVRDDKREARRLDRKADRDGDADLTAYNAYLASLAAPARPTEEDRAPRP